MNALLAMIIAQQQARRAATEAAPVLPREAVYLPTDVIVEGKSLTAAADVRRTPCVLITPAAGDRDRFVSVVVATITGRHEPGNGRRHTRLTVDCNLSAVPAKTTFAVLLNGPRDGSLVPSELIGTEQTGHTIHVMLPAITSPGDRVVMFCDAVIAHAQLAHHGSPAISDSRDEWMGRCGKR